MFRFLHYGYYKKTYNCQDWMLKTIKSSVKNMKPNIETIILNIQKKVNP